MCRALSTNLNTNIRWYDVPLTAHGWFDIDDFTEKYSHHWMYPLIVRGCGRHPSTWKELALSMKKMRFLVMWHPTPDSLQLFLESCEVQGVSTTNKNAPFHILKPDFSRKPRAIKVTHGHGSAQTDKYGGGKAGCFQPIVPVGERTRLPEFLSHGMPAKAVVANTNPRIFGLMVPQLRTATAREIDEAKSSGSGNAPEGLVNQGVRKAKTPAA